MSSFIKITTFSRDTGRQNSKSVRLEKKVPAVVYGPKVKNHNFSISIQDSVKYSASKYNNEIFELESKDKEINQLKVLCKSTSIHPVKREPVHMDFYALNMKENITVDLNLKFEGLEELQKQNLEVNIAQKSISIECSPTEIPEFAVVDLSPLKVGDSFSVEQLNLKGIKILAEPTMTLANVTEKKEEEEEVAAEAVSPADTPSSPDAKSADAKSSDGKPTDEKSSDGKSSDDKKNDTAEKKKS